MFSNVLARLAVSALLLAAAGCASDSVTLRKSKNSSETVTVQKLNCDRLREIKNTREASVEVSGIMEKMTAKGTYKWETSKTMQWDKAMHALIFRYETLCENHNTAHITLEEFDRERKALDRLATIAMGVQDEVSAYKSAQEAWTARQASAEFQKLDAAAKQAETTRTEGELAARRSAVQSRVSEISAGASR